MILRRRFLQRCALSAAGATLPAGLGAAIGQPGAQPGQAASTPAPPDPSAVARLTALGRRSVSVHNPSTIVQAADGEYWLFRTGRGVPSLRSKDLVTWEAGPPVLTTAPAWVATAVPGNRNTSCWAPDVIRLGDRYLVYYAVSTFGSQTSAIALATNRALNPSDPVFQWTDEGIVIQSDGSVDFNAIDAAVTTDAEGNPWLAFGSFWKGIKLIALDRATGKRIAPDSTIHALAYHREIEAPFLYRHGADYFLFVNWGRCCRGLNSTYDIRVGRSRAITGPYLDKAGVDLRNDGGTVLVSTDRPYIGPGHAGILEQGGQFWFSCHFYDGTTPNGTSMLSIRPMHWDAAGWPKVDEYPPVR